jgi:hypothetical protein
MNQFRKLALIIQVFSLIFLRPIKILFWIRYLDRSVYLKDWLGELGNNMIQIANARYIADKINSPLYVPEHKFLQVKTGFSTHPFVPDKFPYHDLSSSTILFNDLAQQFSHTSSSIQSSLVRNFFYQYDCFPFLLSLVDYRNILKNQIFPLINYQKDTSVGDETLVIHIRSGDIFNGRNVHNTYVQPPLSFYLKIIHEFGFEDILIVTQNDFSNPCITQLKQRFPDLRIQSSSLEKDVSTILSARNLVVGVSTFSLALGFASHEIRRLYVPQLEVKRGYWRKIFWPQIFRILFDSNCSVENLDFQIHRFRILKYISIGDWHNSQAQQDWMINHPCDYVFFNEVKDES